MSSDPAIQIGVPCYPSASDRSLVRRLISDSTSEYVLLSTSAEERISTKRYGAALCTCTSLGTESCELFSSSDRAGYVLLASVS